MLVMLEKPGPPVSLQLARQSERVGHVSPSGASIAGKGHRSLIRVAQDKMLGDAIAGVHVIGMAAQ